MALLATERSIKPSSIQRISERHHALARCLASGMSTADACVITGYTPSRISILKGDPAFEELVSFYQSDKAQLVQDLGDKMRQNALEAQNLIAERLEDESATIGIDQLLDITKLGADRTGFGPQSKSSHLHVHMNFADRLKAARQSGASASAAVGPGKVIEGSLAPSIASSPKEPIDE